MLSTESRIKAYRCQHEMSHADVAKELNITERTYWNREKNGKWKLSEIIKLSELYGVAVSELVGVQKNIKSSTHGGKNV